MKILIVETRGAIPASGCAEISDTPPENSERVQEWSSHLNFASWEAINDQAVRMLTFQQLVEEGIQDIRITDKPSTGLDGAGLGCVKQVADSNMGDMALVLHELGNSALP